VGGARINCAANSKLTSSDTAHARCSASSSCGTPRTVTRRSAPDRGGSGRGEDGAAEGSSSGLPQASGADAAGGKPAYDQILKLPKGSHLGTALVTRGMPSSAGFEPLVNQLPKDYEQVRERFSSKTIPSHFRQRSPPHGHGADVFGVSTNIS